MPQTKAHTRLHTRLGILALGLTLLLGCAQLAPQEQQTKRAELDEMGEKTLATLLETEPEAREVLEKSVGYMVVDMTVTKVPVVGAGYGLGVIVGKSVDAHSYVEVTRFEVGGGLGAQKFKVIVFFYEDEVLRKASSGVWHFGAGAEGTAGTASAEGKVTTDEKRYRAFKIVEGGAVATVTVQAAYLKPYLE